MIIISRIKEKYDKPLRECKQTGSQRVCLDGFQDFTIFKGEDFFPAKPMEPRCDCIVVASFNNRVYLIVVELRSGTIRAEDVRKKLRNCESIAHKKFHADLPSDCRCLFCLVSESGPTATETKILDRHRIHRINYRQKLISILPKEVK